MRWPGIIFFICSLLAAPSVQAGDQFSVCTRITDTTARLACYDKAAGYQEPIRQPETQAVTQEPAQDATSTESAEDIPDAMASTYLERIWELSDATNNGQFRFRPYRPNYFLPWRHSSRPNQQPSSPTQPVTTAIPIQNDEVRFQLSFKTKLIEGLFDTPTDLWFGYTQQSNWQLYNRGQSSPFRETNYEPELILSTPMNTRLLGMHWRLLNAGFVHQSNGRANPYSRSWNRFYLQAGLERGNFLLMVRPWYRLPESSAKDDNPDIRQYMGSGDIKATWIGENHTLSALGRYSVQGHRGALQLNWVFPVKGRLKGYAEYFNGYGENLIDYNHRQQVMALGVLISTWP